MKFDCVIMNPPYCRNLHLKILAETIKHLKDDESVCVNLSPIRWLQDPLAKYKKHTDYTRFESSISKHIENVIIIKASEANNLFNIKNFTDLGIYVCKKYTKNNYDYENTLANEYLGNKKSIFTKIFNFCITSNFKDKIKFNLDGISVKINVIFGGHKNPYTLVTTNHSHPYINGVTEDGKTYAQCAFKKKDVNENKQEQSTIKFDTINEAKNFIKIVQTNFLMFVNSLTKRNGNVNPKFLPWLGDAINPRTGLKGYEGEWTDDDLYKFFNITSEEQKIIEETMEKYIK